MTFFTFPTNLDLQLRERDGVFVGIGEVRANGVALRNGARPWWIDIRTPEGERLRDFRLLERAERDGGLNLTFGARVESQTGAPMEWMLHEVRPRVNTSDWNAEPQECDARLNLELRPVSRDINGRTWAGFSYRFAYESESLPIYKVLERGTWEIGGDCESNEFWLRNGTAPPVARFDSPDEFYSTEWYLPGIHNPNIFQFHPLQTQLQGFTWTRAAQGTLMTWATRPAHVRSLFEKKRGSREIEHWHEHCDDLSARFETATTEVLWCAGERSRVDAINDYLQARELVYETLHRKANWKRERVTTYGIIEEWGPADMARYADVGVPRLTEAGVRTIFMASHFANNMNVWDVSNMCCNVDFKVPDHLAPDLARAGEAARNAGAGIEMWGNTAVSTLTWIFDSHKNHPAPQGDAPPGTGRIEFLPRERSIMEVLEKSRSPWIRNPSGAIEADHYTPVFCALNLRDEVVRDYWLRSWRTARERFKLSGIFLDSSFNMSNDKFHWIGAARGALHGATPDQTHLFGNVRPEEEPPAQILSQYHAHLSLMAEMQSDGYAICGEDIGVFGTHRSGPDALTRLDNLWMWNECVTPFNPVALTQAGANADDVFFRGLAYRQMWQLNWHIGANALSWSYSGEGQATHDERFAPTSRQLQLLRAFNEVNAQMLTPHVLPDASGEGEAGVLYEGETPVLWAFEELELPPEWTSDGARIFDVAHNEAVAPGTRHAPQGSVWRLTRDASPSVNVKSGA